ncbi:MAG: magnesium/cobalt transporter CorA [Chloroflexi bacterium]|jgi:magnesium transporter|nr:magnesium/cobalt transporter CorA [Chloroflexota bacterium]
MERPTVEEEALLSEVFHFHHLAIEDCISQAHHPPKIDDYRDYLFIITHGVNHEAPRDQLETSELRMFLGKNYVVTVHWAPLRGVASIRERCQEDTSLLERGSDSLAYVILDAQVDDFMPVLDQLSERIDGIENEVLQNPTKKTSERILLFKRDVLALNRIAAPQLEVINRLSRKEFSIMTEPMLIYFRDIYDHLARVESLTGSLMNLGEGVLSTYLAAVSNRQNEVMKVLSIVASIFLPLTLLTGIYGMNFQNMPELQWQYGYYAIWGVIVVVGTGMFIYFKKKRTW